MVNNENISIEEQIELVQNSRQTTIIVPYLDELDAYRCVPKEVILSRYKRRVGRTIRYLDVDWNVDSVDVIDGEIHIKINKDTIK